MIKIAFLQIFLLFSFISFGQSSNSLLTLDNTFKKQIESIGSNPKINADSTYSILSNWNQYPVIKGTKKWYLFLYKDFVFGTVPLKIYVPENYQNNISSPAVLILHGATTMSSFKDAYKDSIANEEIFYSYFADHNFIVIRPFADGYGPNATGKINFDWVINRFNGINIRNKTNPTYQSLVEIINQLKGILNIDDNKIFALGHSDGSDGVFALDVYKPSCFAGLIAYNSMLTTLGDYDIYIRNTLNRPLYLVHSDLDDLRPIQQTRLIMKILDSLNSPVLYKEYIGYQHYDKHLQIDLPHSFEWMNGISRNPFQKNISWEMSDSNFNGCDWLRVTKFDTALDIAQWHTVLNTKSYNKKDKIYMDYPYYVLNKSVAVRAHYNNNTFEVNTSRIEEVELFISPVMVNLQNPVIVKVDGREVFNKKVMADKVFLLANFSSTFDRKALWVTSIKVKTN